MKISKMSPRIVAAWDRCRRRDQVFRGIQDRLVDQSSGEFASAENTADVGRFFEGRVFRPALLADEIGVRTAPLICCGGTFYQYIPDGVWRAVDDCALESIGRQLLGTLARTSWIRDSVSLLGMQTKRSIEEFIPNPDYINLRNGMLNVLTGDFVAHAPEFHSRVQLPYGFVPAAGCQRWLQFLAEVFPDDPDQARTLQQIFGYCLTTLTFLQSFFLFVGHGANGKGVTLSVLEALIGRENVCSVGLDQLNRPFMACQLKDKLVNFAGEVDTSRPLRSNTIKAFTGEDTITADVKNRDPITFKPVVKFIFAINEMLRFLDASYALRRRVVFLLFTRTFDESSRDPDLKQKLIAELPGILNWALEGLRNLLATGQISKSRTMLEYEEKFAEAMNPVLSFVKAKCRTDEECQVKRSALFLKYTVWHTSNISDHPLQAARFYRQLEESLQGVRRVRIKGVDYFKGIELKPEPRTEKTKRAKKNRTRRGGRGGIKF